jgi:hypothetical protein
VFEAGEGTQIGVWRRDTDRWIDLMPFTPSPAVRPTGEANELSVRAIGSRLRLIVNGVQIAEIVDTVLETGGVGIYAAGDGNQVEVDQFTVSVP